jgi:glycosyltransferase involved in cell wall biosynthesis
MQGVAAPYASAMTDAAPRILAVIPAHDEGPRIEAVVRGAAADLPVLVVDDGSSDDTAARAESAGARVLRQVPNQGKGAALRAGFRVALDEGLDAVVTLDGDGQHDPAELPKFVAAFSNGTPTRPELVVGRRDFRRMPPVRRLSNVVGGAAFSWAVGQRVPDNQSGYRLLGRRLMERTLSSDERGFEFEVEMLTLAIRDHLPIAWVPIRTIYAGEPSHIRPVDHLRQFIRIVRKARRDVRGGGER